MDPDFDTTMGVIKLLMERQNLTFPSATEPLTESSDSDSEMLGGLKHDLKNFVCNHRTGSVPEEKFASAGASFVEYCRKVLRDLILEASRNASQCESPVLRHNPPLMNQTNLCGWVGTASNQTVLPVLLCLCLIGNTMNLLIYRLPYFRGNTAVHFLCGKALANLGFLLALLFEMIHAMSLLGTTSRKVALPGLEEAYWHSRPYLTGIANVFGTMATWFTLVVTLETLVCVSKPFLFRQYFTTPKLTYWIIGIVTVVSVALHATYVTTLEVYRSDRGRNATCVDTVYYVMVTKRDRLCQLMAYTHLKVYLVTVMLIPNLAMLIATVLIVTNFRFKDLGESFSRRRRCVLSLTVATTVSHLILEGPQIFTSLILTFTGIEKQKHGLAFCLVQVTVNLMSAVNATAPFFVYLYWNEAFRRMAVICLHRVAFVSTADELNEAAPPTRAGKSGAARGTERQRQRLLRPTDSDGGGRRRHFSVASSAQPRKITFPQSVSRMNAPLARRQATVGNGVRSVAYTLTAIGTVRAASASPPTSRLRLAISGSSLSVSNGVLSVDMREAGGTPV